MDILGLRTATCHLSVDRDYKETVGGTKVESDSDVLSDAGTDTPDTPWNAGTDAHICSKAGHSLRQLGPYSMRRESAQSGIVQRFSSFAMVNVTIIMLW